MWLMAAVAAVLTLSMFLRGRLGGGGGVNALGIAYFAVAFLSIHALFVATWKARLVGGNPGWSFFRKSRPAEVKLAKVWWWGRLAIAAWLTMMFLLALFYLLGSLGVLGPEWKVAT
jgi:hypothetical protein